MCYVHYSVYEEVWSDIIPVTDKFRASVLDHLRLQISEMETYMVTYYDEALTKFPYLLAYFDDRGRSIFNAMYCKSPLNLLHGISGQ